MLNQIKRLSDGKKLKIKRVFSLHEAKLKPWTSLLWLVTPFVMFAVYIVSITVFTLGLGQYWYADLSTGPHPLDPVFYYKHIIQTIIGFIGLGISTNGIGYGFTRTINIFSDFIIYFDKPAKKDIVETSLKETQDFSYFFMANEYYFFLVPDKLAKITTTDKVHIRYTFNDTTDFPLFAKSFMKRHKHDAANYLHDATLCVEGEKNMFYIQLSTDFLLDKAK